MAIFSTRSAIVNFFTQPEREADSRICPYTLRASRTHMCIRQLGKNHISYVSFSVKIGHYKSAQTVEKYIMLRI